MILFALVLAACGGEDEEEPAADATETEVVTDAGEETATEEGATEEPVVGGLTGTPIAAATPGPMATPASSELPAGIASPAASPVASPVAGATPEGDSVLVLPAGDEAEDATPAAAAGGSVTLAGEVVLPGTLGETFVIAEDGCVGLNGYSDMRAGRQLVVRDEAGTIIGVTELEATDASDACAWTFALEVEESEFYSVSIPMEVERVFTSEQVEENSGEITVPLG